MPPPARHLHRGLWKHSVPVGGAPATKLPAGGAHLCHCKIQDLTSGSTQQRPFPAVHVSTAVPGSRHASGSTQLASTIHTAYHIVYLAYMQCPPASSS